MKKALWFGVVAVAIIAAVIWSLLSPSTTATKDFPYVIKDGQVYCANGTFSFHGTLVVNADADTFRQPTQEEHAAALVNGRQFKIDAVDADNSFYDCSWVNFSGTI